MKQRCLMLLTITYIIVSVNYNVILIEKNPSNHNQDNSMYAYILTQKTHQENM